MHFRKKQQHNYACSNMHSYLNSSQKLNSSLSALLRTSWSIWNLLALTISRKIFNAPVAQLLAVCVPPGLDPQQHCTSFGQMLFHMWMWFFMSNFCCCVALKKLFDLPFWLSCSKMLNDVTNLYLNTFLNTFANNCNNFFFLLFVAVAAAAKRCWFDFLIPFIFLHLFPSKKSAAAAAATTQTNSIGPKRGNNSNNCNGHNISNI